MRTLRILREKNSTGNEPEDATVPSVSRFYTVCFQNHQLILINNINNGRLVRDKGFEHACYFLYSGK